MHKQKDTNKIYKKPNAKIKSLAEVIAAAVFIAHQF